jgi:phosphatidylserine/phosphatidylglycerophosphate/cardiolipin synthase-like enzyme
MRTKASSGALTVQAVAGVRTVLLGMSVEPGARSKLMGFSVKRTDHATGQEGFLPNFLLFEGNDKGAKPDHGSDRNPIQGFQWSDYEAGPDSAYTYTVAAMQGKPGSLKAGDSVSLEVVTEDPSKGKHGIYFNRGAAGLQAFERRFHGLDPDQIPDRAGYKWLSRGLEEALLAFIAKAEGKGWGLRMAIYEFDYLPVLDALASAKKRGVDVQIVVEEKAQGKSKVREKNLEAIQIAGLEDCCIPRTKEANIAHNKFIVLLEARKPIEVWTGSTNVTKGGIFGHSNVGHLVRDAKVARAYLEYWKKLSEDPEADPLQSATVEANAQPEAWYREKSDQTLKPGKGTVSVVFSPRERKEALNWLAALMDSAQKSAFVTCPFTISKQLKDVFLEDHPYLHYLLLDNEKGKIKTAAREIEVDPENLVAVGAYVGKGGWHQWLEEHLTGYNRSTLFIHTKYMLVDPLGEDPIVVTGSANFSDNSITANDENMLVIRGDTGVADVYLTEFMRLFATFRLRQRAKVTPSQAAPAPEGPTPKAPGDVYLSASPGWADRFYDEQSTKEERLLFSGATA